MHGSGDPDAPDDGPRGEGQLAPSASSVRMDDSRKQAGNPPSNELLEAWNELDVAHEALRAADEELHAQHDQIQVMLQRHQEEIVSRERLTSLLPIAILVTSLEGVVLQANPAAGLVLHRSLRHVLDRPFPSFVAPADRPDFERAVSRLGSGEDIDRLTVSVVPSQGDPLEANVVGIAETGRNGERVLRWAVFPSGPLPSRDLGTQELQTATAFAQMCLLPLVSDDRQFLLRQLCELVARGLPEADAVSITLGAPEEPEWMASDSSLAQQVDGAQMSAGEGPCHDAFRTREIVSSDDVQSDDRWPDFSRGAKASEIRSVLAIPISAGDDCMGVLNAYANEPTAFGAQTTRQVGELFGEAVSAVLQQVTTQGSLSDLANQLEQAMQSRAVIDQAKGMIMAKYGGSAEEAFQRLARLSQRTNTKVRDLARMLIEQAASGGRS